MRLSLHGVLVLIETYWNVKFDADALLEIEEQVLIETYWNVKADEAGDDRTGSGGINRNILECKVILCPAQRAGFFSINRNILECKVIRSTRPSRRSVY